MVSSNPISMISALSLGPMPALVQSEMGDKALQRIFRKSGLTGDLLYSRDGYIPQPALVRFFEATAREAGERWVLGPWVDAIQISDYGLWGDWVLSAPTLRDGLLRGCGSIQLHGTQDTLSLRLQNGKANFSYTFASATTRGYGELAVGGAAALVSYCRAYLSPNWRPDQINLNIPDLTRPDIERLETWFGCRIGKSETDIRLIFEKDLLDVRPRHWRPSAITFQDVVRDRFPFHPVTFTEQIREIVRRNLPSGMIGIEEVACAIGTSVRTLQHWLQTEGESYRSIVKAVRIERAKELLQGGDLSITSIAFELGYEHAPHFTRMFNEEVGVPPSRFASKKP